MRDVLSREIENIKEQGFYRMLRTISPFKNAHVSSQGKTYINFSSNNYLGLAGDPRIISAAKRALDEYGVGSGASRLICGNTPLHDELEQMIAQFKQQEDALLFCTGYMANSGVISVLMDTQDDLIIADKLVHASIIDACRQSPATFRVYPHNNPGKLEKILQSCPERRRTLIITDGVFSMDGDLPPLAELVRIARQYDAWLMVDDAHGTGVLGTHGRGTAEFLGVENGVDIHMGTLSKACGVLGGFVAGVKELKELLINKARSFIYTTGIPAPLCAAAIESLKLIRDEPFRREYLSAISADVRACLGDMGFTIIDGVSPIIPVIIGDHVLVMEIARLLYEGGIIIPGIRYPTVRKGEARLRITLQANHTEDDIENLKNAMKQVAERFGSRILTGRAHNHEL